MHLSLSLPLSLSRARAQREGGPTKIIETGHFLFSGLREKTPRGICHFNVRVTSLINIDDSSTGEKKALVHRFVEIHYIFKAQWPLKFKLVFE